MNVTYPRLFVVFAIGLLTLTSCSSNWHLRRAIKKDPSLMLQGDTTVVMDTLMVTTEPARLDSVIMVSELVHDTVFINRDRVKVKLKFDTLMQTVFVDAECPPDTLFVPYEKEVIVIQPQIRQPRWRKRLGVGLGLSLLALILYLATRRFMSRPAE